MPSSETTFGGRPIYSVGQPKQVQLTNASIKASKFSRGRPMSFVN